jgi:hypothetical protein
MSASLAVRSGSSQPSISTRRVRPVHLALACVDHARHQAVVEATAHRAGLETGGRTHRAAKGRWPRLKKAESAWVWPLSVQQAGTGLCPSTRDCPWCSAPSDAAGTPSSLGHKPNNASLRCPACSPTCPSGLGGCLAHVLWSWVRSPAFRSASPGVAHNSCTVTARRRVISPGRTPCGLHRVLRDGKGLCVLAAFPLNGFSFVSLE